jgi:hypothetical protein
VIVRALAWLLEKLLDRFPRIDYDQERPDGWNEGW